MGLRGLGDEERTFDLHVLDPTHGEARAAARDVDREAYPVRNGIRAVFCLDFEGLEDVLELGCGHAPQGSKFRGVR